jgi:hypothetical protein
VINISILLYHQAANKSTSAYTVSSDQHQHTAVLLYIYSSYQYQHAVSSGFSSRPAVINISIQWPLCTSAVSSGLSISAEGYLSSDSAPLSAVGYQYQQCMRP